MIYSYRGKKYKIVKNKFKDDPLRPNQLIIDFKHCEKVGDYLTIKNRITNGLIWGWLKEIK